MNRSFTKLLVFSLIIISLGSGCAGTKAKTLGLIGGAALASGTIGATTAPKDESQMAHAALWGGSAAALAGVAALFIFDEESKRKETEVRATALELELQRFKRGTEPVLVAEGSDFAGRTLPANIKALVKPGKLRVFKIDRWVENGENSAIHQDQQLEMIPPALQPVSNIQADSSEATK